MLSPKWNDLLNWLETKNPDEPYQYGNSACCLAAQFNAAKGRFYKIPNRPEKYGKVGNFDVDMEQIAKGHPDQPLWEGPGHTFGAALKRAREFA